METAQKQASGHQWLPLSAINVRARPDGQAAWGCPGVAQGGDRHHNKQRLLGYQGKPQQARQPQLAGPGAGEPSAREPRVLRSL